MTLTEAEFAGATVRPSPNFGERRRGPPDMLLLHYTGMDSADEALSWLCSDQLGSIGALFRPRGRPVSFRWSPRTSEPGTRARASGRAISDTQFPVHRNRNRQSGSPGRLP